MASPLAPPSIPVRPMGCPDVAHVVPCDGRGRLTMAPGGAWAERGGEIMIQDGRSVGACVTKRTFILWRLLEAASFL